MNITLDGRLIASCTGRERFCHVVHWWGAFQTYREMAVRIHTYRKMAVSIQTYREMAASVFPYRGGVARGTKKRAGVSYPVQHYSIL